MIQLSVISQEQVRRRNRWVQEIKQITGNFGDDYDRMNTALDKEIAKEGIPALLSHLRLCGAIPEDYGPSSGEEKLYSKYTDAVLSCAFQKIGLKSIVLQERADSADVECVANDFSFVADAKAFRLSRSAKNQKDFKVQAMHGWKRGKNYALIVCPAYQLPVRASQIYEQAINSEVCVFSYSHLAVLVQFAQSHGEKTAVAALRNVFDCIAELQATKEAQSYWRAINRTMLAVHPAVSELWKEEKTAAVEAIEIAKEAALTVAAQDRERIMKLSHKKAIAELIKRHKLANREKIIRAVCDTGILAIH